MLDTREAQTIIRSKDVGQAKEITLWQWKLQIILVNFR